MKCAACGCENDGDAGFCENCGEALTRVCAACGSALKPGARFCKKCGTSVANPAVAVQAGGVTEGKQRDRLAELRQSAPQGLQDKILASRDQLEGERKTVTILFTDIVGSTALAEKLDPEEWKEIVNRAHRRVSEAVYRYEGTVAQLLGDGVLAFFGAPVTHEDDPMRAVRAGLDIQRSIEEYSRQLQGYIENFQLRVGIHSGTVVVGQVGSDLHMEYLAIGDAVNLAARLQSAAQPGKVLLSAATARLVRPAFDLDDLGEISVKGKAEAIQVFEVIGRKAVPVSGRGIEGLSVPLVGRDAELGALSQALAELSSGRGGIVSILGEAGIGKSRLLEEARLAAGQGLHWLEGRSLSYGQALPFWSLIELVKQDLGLGETDPEVRVLAALRRRVNALFGERANEVLPYLAHWIGVHPGGELGERVRGLDGETLKHQALLALVEYFKRAAAEQPLVLVFEDLHWADPSTLEGLEKLLALTDRAALLLLLPARTEREHGSWKLKLKAESEYAHRFTQIELKPLSGADTDLLVERLLAEASLPDSVRRLILERSEGNPFYLEEIVRSLIEQGALVREGKTWKAGAEIARVEIPATLQGVLLARIDRLQEEVRRTLQLASVIGRTFLYRLLEAVGAAEEQLEEDLAQLQRLDLVREKARRPELEYMFKHALTQEAAYASLLLERRAEFHRRVGEALEQLFAERKPEFYGLLAHHFDAAGQRERAASYWIQAGDHARLGDALEEALRSYRRAIELLLETGDRQRASKTWLKLGLCYLTNSEFELAHQANEAAFALEREVRAELPSSVPDSLPEHPLHWLHEAGWLDVQRIFDPAKVWTAHNLEITLHLFAGLAELDGETSVVPNAARSWEVLEGGTRYLFHLRDDLRWTDGTPVTAADYEWSWKRAIPPGGSPYSDFLDVIVGARDLREGRMTDPGDVGVRALGGLTLEVRLESPAAHFLYLVTLPLTCAVPRGVVERWGEEWSRPEHIVSNGPFRLLEADAGRILLARNPDYFGEFKGNLDRYELLTVENREAVRQAYQAGQADLVRAFVQFLQTYVPPDELYPYGMFASSLVLLNPTRPPLDDVRVRHAIAHALNREQWARVPGNYITRPGTGVVPPGMSGYSPDLGLRFDLPLARQYLVEAGFPEGKNLPPLKWLDSSPEVGRMDEVQRQMSAHLGIQIVFDPTPWESVEGDGVGPLDSFDFYPLAWWADYPDPENFLGLSGIFRDLRRMGWRHPRFEELAAAAASAPDRAARLGMYRQADRILVEEEAVVIPLFYTDNVGYATRSWVKGVRCNALSNFSLKDVTIEEH